MALTITELPAFSIGVTVNANDGVNDQQFTIDAQLLEPVKGLTRATLTITDTQNTSPSNAVEAETMKSNLITNLENLRTALQEMLEGTYTP